MSMAGHFYNTMILLKANTLFGIRIYGKQQNAISKKKAKQINERIYAFQFKCQLQISWCFERNCKYCLAE